MPHPRTQALALAALSLPASACFADLGGGDPTSPDPSTSAATSPATTTVDPGTGPDTATGSDASTDPTAGPATSEALTSAGETSTSTGCDDVWYFDIDGDSYGGPEKQDGCGPAPPGYTDESLDCDDTDPDVHPGAEEVCDAFDNDCDVAVDEYPAGVALACNGCRASQFAGHDYYICDAPQRTWDQARAHCQTLLADLAIVDTKEEHLFLADGLSNNAGKLWIGLGDGAIEGEFVWVDGAPLTDAIFWFNGEPNNQATDAPGEADCVAIAVELFNTAWRDQTCTSLRSFACESVGP
jgi:hypothetical protein